MKFKSQLTTETSGSVNGLTASHNRGGRYFRARVTPTNPNTPSQIAARAFLATSATQWLSLLSAAQRTAWNLYGLNVTVTDELGEAIQLSGQQWFIAANSFTLNADANSITLQIPALAPTIFDRGDLSIGATTLGVTAGLSIELSGTSINAIGSNAVMVQMGRPQNPSVSFFKGPWRVATRIRGDTSTQPIVVPTAALPFAIALGQRIWVQVRGLAADGRLSPHASIGPLTVAA